MKKLQTLGIITSSAGFPVKQGTWDFLQQSYQEAFNEVLLGLIGANYDATKIYRIRGIDITVGGGITTITAGSVFYNGEVYLTDAVSFSGVATFGLRRTQYNVNADPVIFTDTSVHSVHNIWKMVFGAATGGDPLLSNYILDINIVTFTDNGSSNSLIVHTNGNNYYRMAAATTSDIGITINSIGSIIGKKATVHIIPSGSGNTILFYTTGTIYVAGPAAANAAAEYIQVNIECCGDDLYFISIVQEFT